MSEPLFKPAPFFLLRSPIWPFESLNEALSSNERWDQALIRLYEKNELLREAISIASPPLYHALKKKPLSDPSKIAQSLLHYVIRMSTRATPFGLFSFVALGKWGDQTQTFFDPAKLYKKARPDMEWVYALISKLCSDPEQFTSLSIYTNPLAVFRGDRLFLNYTRQINPKTSQSSSIYANELVQLIAKKAKYPISVAELLKQLLEAKPALVEDKLLKMIHELLSNQFVLPALLPSLLSHYPLEKLSVFDAFGVDLLLQEFYEYNLSSLGNGEEKLSALQKKMGEIAAAKNYLQVDAAFPETLVHLPHNIGDELTKTAEFLWKISFHKVPFPELLTYHSKFLEKYGVHRTVPLLEMLDPEKGLGSYLTGNKEAFPLLPSNTAQKWDRWLFNAWQECLQENKEELVLDDYSLQILMEESPIDYSKAPFSFDCFFKILANSSQEIDEGKFNLLSFQNSWQGGSTFGRFIDLLGQPAERLLGEFYRQEQKLDESVYFVELSYFPKIARSANVAIHPCLRKYRLDVGTSQGENSLSLEDIYVGATHDRFYLTLKKGEVEIYSCTSNMLNLTMAPVPIRFMQEVSIAKHRSVLPFSWGSLSQTATFLPRVRFQKTIISPATWNLNGKDFTQKTPNQILALFSDWATRWSLPQRFLLSHGDQQLLLDRNHPAHLKEIGLMLKKGESLQFFEYLDKPWLKSKNGDYLPEVVIPFLRNKAYITNQSSSIPLAHQNVPFEKRWKFPGSEWLFVKFYLDDDEKDRFLLKLITSFTEQLKQEALIHKWFFVRYNDPDSHLRIRFKLVSPESLSSILLSLNQTTLYWLKNGFIKNMALAPYEREVERYGGEGLIEAVESFFCADTLATIHLLQQAKRHFFYPDLVLYALSVVHFMSDLGIKQDSLISFFGEQKDQSELKGFREHKQKLISLISTLPDLSLFKTVSTLRKPAIHFLSEQMQKFPSIDLKSIYSSLLHMHCNRLGCKESEEKRAILYARHTLLHLQKKESLASPLALKT